MSGSLAPVQRSRTNLLADVWLVVAGAVLRDRSRCSCSPATAPGADDFPVQAYGRLVSGECDEHSVGGRHVPWAAGLPAKSKSELQEQGMRR
jgi:hypothetical protein